MPVYAYQCTECGTPIEVRQSFSDAALTTCEVCGGRLRKRFDAVGVAFKGSGFYRNDSRSTPGAEKSQQSGSKDSVSASTSASSTTPPTSSGTTS